MQRRFFAVLLMPVCALLLIGCASPPSWVQQGDRAFHCERRSVLYGVGIGGFELKEARASVARMDARTNLADAKKMYVEKTLTGLAQENEEWFNEEALKDRIPEIAGRLAELTPFPIKVIDLWEDTRYLPWEDTSGRSGGMGTVYALAKQELDSYFLSAFCKAFSEIVGESKEEVLKTDMETVLAGLSRKIGR